MTGSEPERTSRHGKEEDHRHYDLETVVAALQVLANAYRPKELAGEAYALYEKFRPAIPGGKAGWGAKGNLDLGFIDELAKR